MIGVMVDGFLRADGVRFLSTMVVEEKRHPELPAIVWQRWIWPRQRLIEEVLTRGRRRGELRPGINLDVATTVIRGAAVDEYLTGVAGDDRFMDGMMDILNHGVLKASVRPGRNRGD